MIKMWGSASSIPRPTVGLYWLDDNVATVAITFGTRGADAIIGVEIEVGLSEQLADRVFALQSRYSVSGRRS